MNEIIYITGYERSTTKVPKFYVIAKIQHERKKKYEVHYEEWCTLLEHSKEHMAYHIKGDIDNRKISNISII